MTQFYQDLPIKGTREQRQPIRFRDAEKIAKKNSKKRNQVRLDKRRFLDYNTPRESSF